MSYSPTPWETDEVITAEKLNNSSLFVINATGVASQDNPQTTPSLDKTYDEIKAAYDAGMTPVICYKETGPVGEASVILQLQFNIASAAQEEGYFLLFNQTAISFLVNCADVRVTELQLSKRSCASTYKTQKLAYYVGS